MNAPVTDSETVSHELPPGESLPSDATSDAGGAVAAASPVSIVEILGHYAPAAPSDQPPPIATNRDGSVKRKPGRPRKVAQVGGEIPTINLGDGSAPATPALAKTPAQRRAQRVSSDELARAILNVSVGGMASLVGPEWQFNSPDEAQGMKSAVSAYIEAKGDGNITPESMLLLVVASYAAPRFAEPNTRDKFGAFFGGAWKAFKGLFGR